MSWLRTSGNIHSYILSFICYIVDFLLCFLYTCMASFEPLGVVECVSYDISGIEIWGLVDGDACG